MSQGWSYNIPKKGRKLSLARKRVYRRAALATLPRGAGAACLHSLAVCVRLVGDNDFLGGLHASHLQDRSDWATQRMNKLQSSGCRTPSSGGLGALLVKDLQGAEVDASTTATQADGTASSIAPVACPEAACQAPARSRHADNAVLMSSWHIALQMIMMQLSSGTPQQGTSLSARAKLLLQAYNCSRRSHLVILAGFVPGMHGRCIAAGQMRQSGTQHFRCVT